MGGFFGGGAPGLEFSAFGEHRLDLGVVVDGEIADNAAVVRGLAALAGPPRRTGRSHSFPRHRRGRRSALSLRQGGRDSESNISHWQLI